MADVNRFLLVVTLSMGVVIGQGEAGQIGKIMNIHLTCSIISVCDRGPTKYTSVTNTMKMKTAGDLFHCIESGSGWEGCSQFCAPDATFKCQVVDALPDAPSLAHIKTVEGLANWQRSIVRSLGNKVQNFSSGDMSLQRRCELIAPVR